MRSIFRVPAIAGMLLLSCLLLPAGEADTEGELKPITARQRVFLRGVEPLLKPYRLDPGIDSFMPLPVGPGNAAEKYATLEVLYPKEKLEGENQFGVDPHGRGVQAIVDASSIRNCELTPHFYPHMESGTGKQPDMLVFLAYRNALLKKADAVAHAGKTSEADSIYRAGLTWGWHLTQDRSSLITLHLGYSIQQKCAEEYAKFLRKNLISEKARRVKTFAEECEEMERRVWAKARVHLGDFRNFSNLFSAARIALHDEDALWRQEAVLALGVLRHGAPDNRRNLIVKDERMQAFAEAKLMEVAAKDPKPWIRKLAVWTVEHITPERFGELKRGLFVDAINAAREGKTETETTPPPTAP